MLDIVLNSLHKLSHFILIKTSYIWYDYAHLQMEKLKSRDMNPYLSDSTL